MVTFKEAWSRVPSDGWLTEEEGRLLWEEALLCTGSILEVGCFKGRSTVLLAQTDRCVIAVDPFHNFHSDDESGDSIERAFRDNMARASIIVAPGPGETTPTMVWEVRGIVALHRMPIGSWPRLEVGFAYLDGDHTYEGTEEQISVALACGAKGICIHDVNDSGGGKEVKRAALRWLGPWHKRVGRMAAWRLT